MRIFAVFILLSVLTLGRLLAQTEKAESKEQLVVPLSEPGKAFRLVAHVMYGSLKVVGYEGKDVVINVTGPEKHRESSGNSGGMRRIGGSAGGDVSAEEDNNTVTVNSGLSRFSLIEIKVPQSTGKFELSALNDGSLIVENVSGEMEVSNTNGPIYVRSVAGSVVANTVNGDVKVDFRSVNPQAPMGFSTLNGNIDVTLPASFKANVKLKAEKGDIYTDYDIDIIKDRPAATKTNEGHMYRVSFDEWVMGKVNGGGPEMMMKTTYGSIYIRKGK